MKVGLILLLLVISLTGYSQTELPKGYYVVVAAYGKSHESLARQFADRLKQRNLPAQYGFNSVKRLFFVYLYYSGDKPESLREMEATRKRGEFTDAWVRIVSGNETFVTQPVTEPPSKSEAKEKPTETLAEVTTQSVEVVQRVDSTKANEENGQEQEEQPGPEEKIVWPNPMTLGNTEVFLSLVYGPRDKVVDGEIQVIDTERTRLITSVKGNSYLLLPDPKSKSGQLTLICDVFGYRKVQHELNYPLPLADTVKPHIDLLGTTIVVNFEMIRYVRGDIRTLYNVYFFNDASIMLPESKYELNSLLEMMKENPNYRIRLHGHTNGHYHGRIVSPGPDKNFFSLTGSTESVGSAKDLSQKRAGIIREYLIANGIAADRMEIKAWGGKRPLFDKHGVNAKKNVRVEVEILSD